jgi:hypothetical protein
MVPNQPKLPLVKLPIPIATESIVASAEIVAGDAPSPVTEFEVELQLDALFLTSVAMLVRLAFTAIEEVSPFELI